MTHEDTHAYPLKQLVAVIIVAIAFYILIVGYYMPLASGSEEMHVQAQCAKLGQIRHSISQIELIDWWPGQSVGQDITDTSLLKLPAGCGYMYKSPCNSTSDCQQKTRDSIGRCWGFIKREPDTSGTCLVNLEINETISGNVLNLANVCGGGETCTGTDAPMSSIDYTSTPQGKDSIGMEYGGSRISVKCMGKCKP